MQIGTMGNNGIVAGGDVNVNGMR